MLLEVVCKYSECTYLSLEKDETLLISKNFKKSAFSELWEKTEKFDFYSKQPCISYLRKKVYNNYYA